MSSPKKRGEGTSCHHCKKRIRPNEMLKCTRGEIVPTNSRKRKRPCVKKYCLHCIKTFYSNQYLDDNSSGSFICPACRDECRCAACRRRVMKARLKTDGSALENEAEGQANGILESQTPDATNIEEGQVNGLLEILDSRPDVQDIIRRGMAMDFADDNAKILYVGHLIDQALTRPDVLALYYASSHGRANNCRIKTESNANNNNGNNSQQQQQQHHNDNDLPPETPINPVDSPQTSSSSSSSSSSGATPPNQRSVKRKRRSHHHHHHQHNQHNHHQHGYHEQTESLSPGHRTRRHHKKKRQNVSQQHEIDMMSHDGELGTLMTVKQEPSTQGILSEDNSNHKGGGSDDGDNEEEQRRTGEGHKNGMIALNGISAPQPATISLSGGNPMGFVNFPPPITNGPPHLGGVNGINTNLPPINLGFPGNNGNHKIAQIPLNTNMGSTATNNIHSQQSNTMNHIHHNHHNDSPNQQSNHSENEENQGIGNHNSVHNGSNDHHHHHHQHENGNNMNNDNHHHNNNSNSNNNIFPMNVTPSVTMGGPSLASM